MSPSSAVVGIANPSMFHTIQFSNPPRPELAQEPTPKSTSNGTSKRITTPHACAECKRRKIRCDGRQPCGQCLGCRSPKPCYYDKHRQRVIPSRKTLDALSQSLEECRTILKRLYPNREVQSLLPLSRQELVSLLDRPIPPRQNSNASPSVSQQSPSSQEFLSPMPSASDDERNFANLEQIPQQDTEWDEERRNRDPLPAEADDVNALSLSVDRQTSFLGASSIKAAFLVMLKVAPGLRAYLAPPGPSAQVNGNAVHSHNSPPRSKNLSEKIIHRISWSSEGQTLIDAYFNRVQIFVPMLDEPSFRATYLGGQRKDGAWLALLNMVFAMGSIVAMKSDDTNHDNFYNRAKEHLELDSFGSGHIEALQALGLMGGYYLHYINRPNMANAILGAALRMACALGLHHESGTVIRDNGSNSNQSDGGSISLSELRRRTWWSLFCLDTWASTTLGRPSLGRWGAAITIRPPEGVEDPSALSSFGQHARILPLIENIKFCKIATDIEDTLAVSALPRHEERNALDSRLVHWHESLPYLLRETTETCPEALSIARVVMKWRYQNLRLVLHRPVLLNIANRSASSNGLNGERKTSYTPSPEDLAAVEACRRIAKETIEDIYKNWSPNQMIGWNAVWFLYQASMVPLISLFWESWNTSRVLEWQEQIEKVLSLFESMIDWSLAARRSFEVVGKMYEASKRVGEASGGGNRSSAPVVERSPGGTVTKREPDDSKRFSVSHGNKHDRSGVDHPMGEIEGLRDVMMSEIQEGYELIEQDNMIWDLNGMLWADGLDMSFSGSQQQYYGGEIESPEHIVGNGMIGLNVSVGIGNGMNGMNGYDGSGGTYMMH